MQTTLAQRPNQHLPHLLHAICPRELTSSQLSFVSECIAITAVAAQSSHGKRGGIYIAMACEDTRIAYDFGQ